MTKKYPEIVLQKWITFERISCTTKIAPNCIDSHIFEIRRIRVWDFRCPTAEDIYKPYDVLYLFLVHGVYEKFSVYVYTLAGIIKMLFDPKP